MSVNFPNIPTTVDKFGIGITGSQGQGPMMQPRLKYRFRVLFLGFGGSGGAGESITLNTNKCDLPKISHEDVKIHSYNSYVNIMGKHTWDDINLEVRDTVDNSVAKQVGAQLQIQLDHYNQTGYRAGQNYKFTTIIQMLDGGNDTGNLAWTLEGCWLKQVQYSDADYSSSDIHTISLTIKYDNAICEDNSGSYSIFPEVAADALGTFVNT
jgi:hypothetical protein